MRNEFPYEVRELWFWRRFCSRCARGNEGLELDHITGRGSNSAYNSYLNCRKCHQNKGGYEDQKRRLKYTLYYLTFQGYTPTDNDIAFLKEHRAMYDGAANEIIEKYDN